MKFSQKLLLWTTIIIALTLGFSGYFFVNYVFETSLEREVGQALDENSILRFAFETAALNVPVKYDLLQDSSVEQIASNLEAGGQGTGRLLRISDEGKNVLYASDGFETDDELLNSTGENQYSYRVIHIGEHYYIQTGSSVNALGRVLYLETLRDVSQVFEERAMGFTVYRRLTILMLVLGIVIMYFIAAGLTKPIRLLMRATKEMAAGDYGYRAKQVSNDELGQLTQDFNHMSEVLEGTIGQLEDEVQAREDFVGAFAHELKTPLTSIIGYADMLRSRKLDEEKSLLSANYIYTEGKRLEAMSLRLLDIIVTKKEGAKIQRVPAASLFEYLRSMFLLNEAMEFVFAYEEAYVMADSNLIQMVLVNLLDNACKASEQGSKIEIEGHLMEDSYRFTVRDYGIGIPEEEISKITQAFYMVDKSRSRSRNGAGLGLSLSTEILALHDSRLEINSKPGEGTTVGFLLQKEGKEEGHAEVHEKVYS
ncbi:MAG: HAMP domain-containing histidine kinase [Eubacterium sp.]|nr:HAMP domain-containing histidine kinase [Eubacterium sp.]